MSADNAVEDAFFAASAAVPEGRRLELIAGQIHMSPMADGHHAEIVCLLSDQIYDHRRDLRLYRGIGLELPGTGPKDRVIPDLVAAPARSFHRQFVWHRPYPVGLVAEVTSKSTADNDRVEKLNGYARAEIPVYVLVDREAGITAVYSEPQDGKYGRSEQVRLGKKIMLPKPFDFELDTAEF